MSVSTVWNGNAILEMAVLVVLWAATNIANRHRFTCDSLSDLRVRWNPHVSRSLI